ncbi:hypothetical protein F5Y00DRAFT_273917 [Daldinia vernicosa]|uniref:uncharacterized protein n=1 Tax=Daldinia vernicosa TaxID=114800 RepID=UPI0020081C34|nr:uncharacterized protein F5Y00DRAFT_273917 [Daldinia vernicosa]KAI0844592.1 hypothetical protein F5Y00DRAFT_273917 [Daldinia vernicosa]
MAASNIKMPAFGITTTERVKNKDHVNALLRNCRALLDNYRKNPSEFDLDDALTAVQDALIIASDRDACESPPLATCYLYKGHALWIMKRYQEAQNAYRLASKTIGTTPADRKASEKAVSYVVDVAEKVREERRKGGLWTETYDLDFPRGDNRSQSRYYKSRSEKLMNTGLHYACPPIQDLDAKRVPCIEMPGFIHKPTPTSPVKCSVYWTEEAKSPTHGGRTLRSMRGRYIDSNSLRVQ